MKLKDIAENQKSLDTELEELLEKEELTETEEKRLTEIETEQADLEKKKAQAERNERLAKEMQERKAWSERLAETPDEIIEENVPAVAPVANVKERVQDDPRCGFERYEDFALAVKRACAIGNPQVHENLRIIQAAYGQNTEVGAEGGFLIPPEYSNRLLERAQDGVPVIEQCDKLTLTGNSVTINGVVDHDKSSTTYRHGGVVVYWVGEGSQITRSSLTFRQIRLQPHKMAALSYVTEEEMEDVANFGTRLLDKQAVAIADELVEAVMFGTGVAKPRGAFVSTSPCVQVAKETGQSADTIVAENVINMNSVIYSGSRGKGNWYYNGECLPQLETMAIAVGTGGIAAFWPAGGLSAKEHGTIKGRPAYETEHCEALGDAGDIVYADWSQYLLAMKGNVKTAMSIHLRFDYDEVAFKSTFRVDGRPAWETNLRPRKSASARRVSPFVKLAERA